MKSLTITNKKTANLYHKQIINKYHEYPIDDKQLKINHKYAKQYLEETIRHHTHNEIPKMVQKMKKKLIKVQP